MKAAAAATAVTVTATTAAATTAANGRRRGSALEDPAVRTLWSLDTVRRRAHALLAAGERGALAHFTIDEGRLDAAARLVAGVTRERHPDLGVPLHSRWRQFELETADGARSRWTALADEAGLAGAARARAAVELAVVSVLLDAGAGSEWRYRDETTGRELARTEGLAAATFDLYRRGVLSSDPARPLRADADGLRRIDPRAFARAFQLHGGNGALAGVEGRIRCLHAIGRAVAARTPFAPQGADGPGAARRLGRLFDHLAARSEGGRLPAHDLFAALFAALHGVIGKALGDVWFHPAVRARGPTDRCLPLHKLFQWLAWSLIEPLAEGGITVTGTQALTGLAEYRNGGLLLDTGVLVPRRPLPGHPLAPGDRRVVEWRGLTVALLDRLRPRVARELGIGEADFSMGQLLEGGTWWAGRRLAHERRPDGAPPIRVASDGTVF